MAVTTFGDNWTVLVFRCPLKKCFFILSELFSLILKDNPDSFPHYTIRLGGENVVISFRIFNNEKEYKEITQAYFKERDIEYSIDPLEPDDFAKYHAWIPKTLNNDYWTKERCLILHKISNFLIQNFNDETSDADKIEYCHLFSNMFGVFEDFTMVRTLSGKQYPQVYQPNILPILRELLKNN